MAESVVRLLRACARLSAEPPPPPELLLAHTKSMAESPEHGRGHTGYGANVVDVLHPHSWRRSKLVGRRGRSCARAARGHVHRGDV